MERKMRNIHPGAILKMTLVDDKKLTVVKVAELLDTTRANMSKIINGHTAISPNMAIRIARVFGGSARHLLSLQSSYDLLEAEKDFDKNPPRISHYDLA